MLSRTAAAVIVLAACSSPAPGPKPVNVRDEDVIAWEPRAPLDGRLRIQPAGMCGGARVPDGYRPPPLAPARGVTLRVMVGEIYSDDVLTNVTTDEDGKFLDRTIPSGSYCVARDHGTKPTQVSSPDLDLECLVKRWESCDAVVSVPVTKPVLIDIREECAWAICYHGPPPP